MILHCSSKEYNKPHSSAHWQCDYVRYFQITPPPPTLARIFSEKIQRVYNRKLFHQLDRYRTSSSLITTPCPDPHPRILKAHQTRCLRQRSKGKTQGLTGMASRKGHKNPHRRAGHQCGLRKDEAERQEPTQLPGTGPRGGGAQEQSGHPGRPTPRAHQYQPPQGQPSSSNG